MDYKQTRKLSNVESRLLEIYNNIDEIEKQLEDYIPIGSIDIFEDFNFANIREKNYIIFNKLRVKFLIHDIMKCIAFIDNAKGEFVVKERSNTTKNFELKKISKTEGKIKLQSLKIVNERNNEISAWKILEQDNNLKYITFEQTCFFTHDRRFFSYFRGFQFSKVTKVNYEIINDFLDHIRFVICSGNMEWFMYLINWLAYMMLHPGTQTEICIVLVGKPGTGKNFFTDTICKLLDAYANPNATLKNFVGAFNSGIVNKMLIVCNELDSITETKDTSGINRLKTYITEKSADIHVKFQNPFTNELVSNFILISNAEIPIQIEEHDRRFFVLEVSDIHRVDTEYFNKLAKTLTPEFFQHFGTFLTTRKVSKKMMNNIPRTDAKQRIIDYCKNFVEQIPEHKYICTCSIDNFVKDYEDAFATGVPREESYNLYNEWCKVHNVQDSCDHNTYGKYMKKKFDEVRIGENRARCYRTKHNEFLLI